MDFYTYVDADWSGILISGYKNGEKIVKRVPYNPRLFIPSQTPTDFKTVDEKYVSPIDFDGISEARDFLKKYKDVPNFKLYGLTNFQYGYIYEQFKDLKVDTKQIRVLNFDIETDSSDGYGSIKAADKEIITITAKMLGQKEVYAFGYKDYNPKFAEIKHGKYDIRYIKCIDESDLLEKFIQLWEIINPDVVTGWNIEFFDIPYIIKRISYNLGEDAPKRLSPFGRIKKSELEVFGNINDKFDIVGVANLDYLQTYKKFSYKNVESYSLDFISNLELGLTKLDYSEFGTLAKLYAGDYDKFVDYNIIDVLRVEQLIEKLKYFDQIYGIAYMCKVNYADTFTTIRMWDIMIHNYLADRNIVIPIKQVGHFTDDHSIAGGYVKAPQIGKHKWVMSFDFKSLYPHLIMTFNISPETYIGKFMAVFGSQSVEKIIGGGLDEYNDDLLTRNLTCTGRGTLFTRERKGFIPDLMQFLFDTRAKYSAIESEHDKILSDIRERLTHGEDAELRSEEKRIEAIVDEFASKSLSIKYILNGGYGALANIHNRWFSPDVAESITLSGQMAVKWVESNVNRVLNEQLGTDGVDYIVAIDTDSIYVKLDTLVERRFGKDYDDEEVVDFLEKFSDVMQGIIQEALDNLYRSTNAYEPKLHMALEAIGPAIWIAKKRYIMSLPSFKKIRQYPPKIKMQGIDAVRSSTPKIVRDYIKDAIPMLINGNATEIKQYVDEKRKDFTGRPYEEVAFPRSANNLDKYADPFKIYKPATPIAVRGALLYNHMIKSKGMEKELPLLRSGDKLRYCYMTLPNPLMEDVFATQDLLPAEFEMDEYIDYSKQFEKSFMSPIQKIVDAIGIDLSDNIDINMFLV